ncbi:MAG: HD domain-containing protein [Clostridia bacterium]|nr:HD domain-containing protein [Clostridia bacterium]
MPTIVLPAAVREILDRLTAAGFAAYVVGGCVRDSLMGRLPGDWDICTAAPPETTLALFAATHRPLPTGLKHGTVTLFQAGTPYEVTTFRTEGAYSDGRRPDSVRFVSEVTEDLARRDFTVNAMAYHPDSGLVDPFDGQGDLSRRLLRCVGHAETRFLEDALRLLRALRFAASLGFALESETAKALRALAGSITRVSPERIFSELTKLLCADGAAAVLARHPTLLFALIPELERQVGLDQRNPHHCHRLWEHTLAVLAATPARPALRLAALLHDVAKPFCFTVDRHGVGHFYGHPEEGAERTEEILRRLRCPNQLREQVTRLVLWHDERTPAELPAVRRLVRDVGWATLPDLLALQRADTLGQSPQMLEQKLARVDGVEALLDQVRRERLCCTVAELAIDGGELLALGCPGGPAVGRLLSVLLDEVIEGRLDNSRAALSAAATELLRRELPG